VTQNTLKRIVFNDKFRTYSRDDSATKLPLRVRVTAVLPRPHS